MKENNVNPDTVKKVWQIIKQIIEIIIAALGGLAAGATANAAGFTNLFA